MSETTTLEIDGTQVTIDTRSLFSAWFEKHFMSRKATPAYFPKPRLGERRVGSIIEPDGRTRHIFLLPGDDKKSWNDGLTWANEKGGDLPDRLEFAMLRAFMPEEFQKEAYWSNEQHAGLSHSAWYQHLTNGSQSSLSKTFELRVRAVRREISDSPI